MNYCGFKWNKKSEKTPIENIYWSMFSFFCYLCKNKNNIRKWQKQNLL